MIGLDTNVILHLLVKSQKEHLRAKAWFSAVREPLGTTGTNVAETLRLLTHPRVFPSPLSLVPAIDLVKEFIDRFDITLLEESEDWWMELNGLSEQIPSLRGNEVFDARIALCLRYNGIKEICTLDANFAKYPFLKIVGI